MLRKNLRVYRALTAVLWASAALVFPGLCLQSSGAAEPKIDLDKLPPATTRPVDFKKDIQGILAATCLKCHGPEKQKGGLRLDVKSQALKGGDSGPAIVPGAASKSRLLLLIGGLIEDEQMPPEGELLSREQIGLIRAWIEQGAVWPDDEMAQRARSQHWAFQPIQKPAPPAVKESGWIKNPIDNFILAGLEQAGLKPSPTADKLSLIRRLSFDLTGLPPTPEEMDSFLADTSSSAWEKLIDRLLTSPQYGARWGRHWLDVARYTESQGFEYDHPRDNAWHYRDYVIASFNSDKPYHVFVQEQIAGDVLPSPSMEGIIATSFLVCGPWDQAGSGQANIPQRMLTREEELEDMLSVVGQTFLGLTINCARCHSHKFDPIPQEEYYRIKSVFDGVWHGERPLATAEEASRREAESRDLKEQISRVEERVRGLEQMGRQRAAGGERIGNPEAAKPYALWTFEEGPSEVNGNLGGQLMGGAVVRDGALRLNGERAYLKSKPLPKDIREKTLLAWVALSRLDQGGGSALTIQHKSGDVFDGIVYGERESRKWMAGSEFYFRTKDLDAEIEGAKPGELILMAIVYRADQQIEVYRNGELYGTPYDAGQVKTYAAGESEILIGLRHGAANGKKFLHGVVEEAALYDRALASGEVRMLYQSSLWRIKPEQIQAALSGEEKRTVQNACRELEELRDRLKAMEKTPTTYAGVRKQPEPTRRLKRGDVKSPEEVVTPGALSAIYDLEADFHLPADAPEAERRKKFAEWLTDPRNPLPARVMVNRLWHYHFGQGLVLTPNDFGASGGKPSHPELLDWLAATFVESGWSMKQMHRLMVTSAAYRQASVFREEPARLDADNKLLWRYAPRRLEAEAVRDAILMASGQINLQQGGPSFRPFDTKVFNATFYFPVDKIGPEFNRRTVYRMNVNSGKEPMLEAFDCPDPGAKAPKRGVTSTPLQALSMMNSSFVQRQAKALAELSRAQAGGDSDRAIQIAYRRALGRLPESAELAEASALVRETALENLCWALFNATEFLYVR